MRVERPKRWRTHGRETYQPKTMPTLVPPLHMADTNAPDLESGADASAEVAADAHRRFVAALFARYGEPLLRYVSGLLRSRHEAEDVVQEAYVRMLGATALDRVESRARAYLFKVATNLAYDRFRARRESRRVDVEAPAPDAGPDVVVDFAQGLAIIERALLELKPRCRQVFLLRASEQLEYEEIAARLGVSKRTVEREMHHALDVCQRRLKRSR